MHVTRRTLPRLLRSALRLLRTAGAFAGLPHDSVSTSNEGRCPCQVAKQPLRQLGFRRLTHPDQSWYALAPSPVAARGLPVNLFGTC